MLRNSQERKLLKLSTKTVDNFVEKQGVNRKI